MSDNYVLSLGQLLAASMSLFTIKGKTASGLLRRRGQGEGGAGLHNWTTTPGWKCGGEGVTGHALNNKHNSFRADTEVNNVTNQKLCVPWLSEAVGIFCIRTDIFDFSSDGFSLSPLVHSHALK